MTAPVMVGPPPAGGGPVRTLTDLELDVLQYISQGLSYAEIGQRTAYSRDGILKASTRILRKMNARNRAHAVFLACQAGILDGRPRSQRHGDHVGYTNHQKRGEEACAACKAGESAYQVQRRAARKAAMASTS